MEREGADNQKALPQEEIQLSPRAEPEESSFPLPDVTHAPEPLETDEPSNTARQGVDSSQLPNQDAEVVPPEQPLRRSSRQWKPTAEGLKCFSQRDLFGLSAEAEVANPCAFEDPSEVMNDPISFLAKTDQDTMCHHQAMKQEDSEQFKLAMQQEIDAHTKFKQSGEMKFPRERKWLIPCGP